MRRTRPGQAQAQTHPVARGRKLTFATACGARQSSQSPASLLQVSLHYCQQHLHRMKPYLLMPHRALQPWHRSSLQLTVAVAGPVCCMRSLQPLGPLLRTAGRSILSPAAVNHLAEHACCDSIPPSTPPAPEYRNARNSRAWIHIHTLVAVHGQPLICQIRAIAVIPCDAVIMTLNVPNAKEGILMLVVFRSQSIAYSSLCIL